VSSQLSSPPLILYPVLKKDTSSFLILDSRSLDCYLGRLIHSSHFINPATQDEVYLCQQRVKLIIPSYHLHTKYFSNTLYNHPIYAIMMPVSSTLSSPSRSIPINTNNMQARRLARADEAFEREAAMADYVDYCFATRLVNGMQKRQSMTHDISLRYENQALIDHIIATRQNRSSMEAVFPTSGSRSRTTPERSDSNEKLRKFATHDGDSLQHGRQYEEDMMFDMEL
jgi:hypothetical protein